MKKVIFLVSIVVLLFMSGCDNGKEDVIRNIKHDISVEYQVPITDIDVETIEYGVTKFTTNQFKVTVESKGLAFNLVDTRDSNDYTRYPIPVKGE